MLEEENIVVAEVNCVDNVEVCEQEDIEGYPTINLYDNKFKVNYNEQRTADAVVKWIQKYNNAKINIITKEQLINAQVPYVLFTGDDTSA